MGKTTQKKHPLGVLLTVVCPAPKRPFHLPFWLKKHPKGCFNLYMLYETSRIWWSTAPRVQVSRGDPVDVSFKVLKILRCSGFGNHSFQKPWKGNSGLAARGFPEWGKQHKKSTSFEMLLTGVCPAPKRQSLHLPFWERQRDLFSFLVFFGADLFDSPIHRFDTALENAGL